MSGRRLKVSFQSAVACRLKSTKLLNPSKIRIRLYRSTFLTEDNLENYSKGIQCGCFVEGEFLYKMRWCAQCWLDADSVTLYFDINHHADLASVAFILGSDFLITSCKGHHPNISTLRLELAHACNPSSSRKTQGAWYIIGCSLVSHFSHSFHVESLISTPSTDHYLILKTRHSPFLFDRIVPSYIKLLIVYLDNFRLRRRPDQDDNGGTNDYPRRYSLWLLILHF